jgi:hypothetical protein
MYYSSFRATELLGAAVMLLRSELASVAITWAIAGRERNISLVDNRWLTRAYNWLEKMPPRDRTRDLPPLSGSLSLLQLIIYFILLHRELSAQYFWTFMD